MGVGAACSLRRAASAVKTCRADTAPVRATLGVNAAHFLAPQERVSFSRHRPQGRPHLSKLTVTGGELRFRSYRSVLLAEHLRFVLGYLPCVGGEKVDEAVA